MRQPRLTKHYTPVFSFHFPFPSVNVLKDPRMKKQHQHTITRARTKKKRGHPQKHGFHPDLPLLEIFQLQLQSVDGSFGRIVSSRSAIGLIGERVVKKFGQGGREGSASNIGVIHLGSLRQSMKFKYPFCITGCKNKVRKRTLTRANFRFTRPVWVAGGN